MSGAFQKPCPYCGGRGYLTENPNEVCETCKGRGAVLTAEGEAIVCLVRDYLLNDLEERVFNAIGLLRKRVYNEKDEDEY